MRKFILERRKELDNEYLIIELDKWGGKKQLVHGIIIVQRENNSPYAYRIKLTDELSNDDWKRLEIEAVGDYFDGRRMW